MRNSKKNIAKRNKKYTNKSIKCVYTDEAKRIMKMIRYIKKNNTSKKR